MLCVASAIYCCGNQRLLMSCRFPQDFRDDYVESDEEVATANDAALSGGRAASGCTAYPSGYKGKGEQTSATAAGGRSKGEAGGSSETEREGDEDEHEAEDEPDSFSRVDLAAGPKEAAARFPDFPGMDAALQVEVQKGGFLIGLLLTCHLALVCLLTPLCFHGKVHKLLQTRHAS